MPFYKMATLFKQHTDQLACPKGMLQQLSLNMFNVLLSLFMLNNLSNVIRLLLVILHVHMFIL